MDYPRVKLSCIQWEFEGEEKVLFKEQFLNWDEAEVQVDIPVEPVTKKDICTSPPLYYCDFFIFFYYLL